MNVHSTPRGNTLPMRQSGVLRRLVARGFHHLLDRIDSGLEMGSIEAVLPDGQFRILGGRAPGPVAHVTLYRWNALVRLGRSGSAGWYEAFAAGEWDSSDPVPLFDLFMRNRVSLGKVARASGMSRLAKRLRHALRNNDRKGAARNIMAHYDLGNDFYALWLDRTMSYSSGLFADPLNGEEPLHAAQKRKCAALARRLDLRPGSDVLEIGSGWGYFSRLCAANGHRVTAITLSPSQKLWSERAARGENRPDYRLLDYRDVTGLYDAIASVEMVEAVGQRYWPEYLDAIARLLKPGGRAALQFIAIADDAFDAYAASADFIQTFVFPGGMLLSESLFRSLAEARGFQWEDPHHFPMHYAETLRRWRVRFDDAVDTGRLPTGFDARFVKLWRYYLQYCEGGFKGGGITVVQVTLVKEGVHDEKMDAGSGTAARRMRKRHRVADRQPA
jgi:cyclopropane-fatty-acyl-phospholipid synthase